MEGLTKTQQRIYDLLADGKSHRSKDVLKKCMDEGSDMNTMRFHMTRLRNKLASKGKTVMSELVNGKIFYRLINTSDAPA